MQYIKYFLVFVLGCSFLLSCKDKETKYPNVPSIRLLTQNTDVINYTDSAAALRLNFELIDGDGDIAKRDPLVDSSVIALVIRENDQSELYYKLSMPQVQDSDFMKNGGLKASMILNLPNYFFYPRTDSLHLNGLDTMHLGIYVQDYAGNKSDTIIVGPIYMEP